MPKNCLRISGQTVKTAVSTTNGRILTTLRFIFFQHTSRYAQRFMEVNGVRWWRTPPESPDLNPIELIWHELKEYIRGKVKPATKEELVGGIRAFWKTVTPEKCAKYINHLRKVIPKVVELKGGPTGY